MTGTHREPRSGPVWRALRTEREGLLALVFLTGLSLLFMVLVPLAVQLFNS